MTSIVKGIFGGGEAKAAKKAGRVQEAASLRAAEGVDRRFEQTRQDLSQFRDAASPALGQFQSLLGLQQSGETPEQAAANQQIALSQIQASPGQQFIRQRAQRNLLRNASAIGGLGGGNVRSALVEQGAGFGAQDLQNQFGRLQNLISGGQNAAAQTGQFGAQAAQNVGQLQQQGAQARASGILGAQQAKSKGLSNLIGLGTSLFTGGFNPFGGAAASGGLNSLGFASDYYG